ncbi:hypothetical protein PAMC26577_12050 [Caballeronia sordidicola]|uniref:Uncharacterized protein n=1 Tax=Caballeronia sordidicola TaxID=196367 RepID=A0A242MX63_CABSO|nr:hypothetical protein PAMC26577_12050 [Caballeronia sordidicola]
MPGDIARRGVTVLRLPRIKVADLANYTFTHSPKSCRTTYLLVGWLSQLILHSQMTCAGCSKRRDGLYTGLRASMRENSAFTCNLTFKG